MPDGIYSLADLCGLADVTPRTVRYYIAQGLLRSPGTTGPGARYDDGHLARLRLIRRLQREHLPLAEIRARLAALTDDEAIARAEGPAEPPVDSALDYVRDVLGVRALRASSLVAARRDVGPRSAQMLVSEQIPARAAAPPAAELPPSAPAAPAAPAAPPAAAGGAPPAADRSHWERYTLAPDVELHVRRPLTRSQNRAVASLVEAARRLLEEDQP
jgi:DNA-binding transcriptional MerR regulator